MNKLFPIAVILAAILGFAAAFGTLMLRWSPLIETSKKQPDIPSLKPKDWDFWTLESNSLSEELLKERKLLKERAKDLDAWQQKLAAEKAELIRVREQIEAIRKEIDQTVITLMEAERPNLKSLSRSYSAMKAAQAVAIFRKTNDDIIVKILSLMKPDTVALILSEMASDANTSPRPQGGNATANPAEEMDGSTRAARITEMLRLLKQENLKQQTP
jgi:hypothetical protein